MKKMTRCIVILLAFTAISAISISCARTDFPDEGGTQGTSEYEFKRFQQIPTIGACDWEHFSIEGVGDFLIVANEHNNSTYNINSVLYLWNGYTFEVYQTISTNGALDWEHIVIDGKHYLAVANYYAEGSYTTSSQIYKWDGTQFVSYQAISTNGAIMWKFFTIDNVHYLMVANSRKGSNYNIDSTLYSFGGSGFTFVQNIQTHGAYDWEYFEINGEHYIAVANYYDDSTGYVTNSYIYKWNKNSSTFDTTPIQAIPTTGATNLECFSIGSDHYLAIANNSNGSSNKLYSKLYKWNEDMFTPVIQDILTYGAADWEYFSLNGEQFLAVASCYNSETSSYKTQSVIYKLNTNTNELTPWQSIETTGACALQFFTIGNRQFLVVANFHDDSSYNINSTIYILDKK